MAFIIITLKVIVEKACKNFSFFCCSFKALISSSSYSIRADFELSAGRSILELKLRT